MGINRWTNGKLFLTAMSPLFFPLYLSLLLTESFEVATSAVLPLLSTILSPCLINQTPNFPSLYRYFFHPILLLTYSLPFQATIDSHIYFNYFSISLLLFLATYSAIILHLLILFLNLNPITYNPLVPTTNTYNYPL